MTIGTVPETTPATELMSTTSPENATAPAAEAGAAAVPAAEAGAAAPVAAEAALAPADGLRARVARLRATRPWTLEWAIFAIALLVYQLSRALVVGEPSQAFENAARIISWEQSSGLFVEAGVQEWVLNHVRLTELLNYFYMSAHWVVTVAFFVWLYKRHGRVYPYVRNGFLAANALALAVYTLYPVAPPRLMAGGEFVDTLAHVSDINLQDGLLSGLFNPHAAVPSMHFGYAFMIAMVALVLLRSWPLRLVAVAYPAVVLFTIVATANHYIADAVAGGIVISAGFLAIWAWMHARGRLGGPARTSSATAARPALQER